MILGERLLSRRYFSGRMNMGKRLQTKKEVWEYLLIGREMSSRWMKPVAKQLLRHLLDSTKRN